MAAYYTISMYPVQFSVDYPDRPLDRKSTLLRVFYVLPIWVVLAFMSGTTYAFGLEKVSLASAQVGGVLFVPIVLMLLFQNKYPRWWFEWNLALMQFTNRVVAYMFLLTDVYPSTDEEQSVHLDIAYPDTEWGLNRVMPLFKWLFAFPHYIALVGDDRCYHPRLVRYPVHRTLSAPLFRFQCRRHAMGKQSGELRIHPGNRHLPALSAPR